MPGASPAWTADPELRTDDDKPMVNTAPTDEMLAAYATGTASPGIELLVAAHLTYAPHSRARVAELERLGGALLASTEPEPMENGMDDAALDRALAAIDALPDPGATPPARPNGAADAPLPRPVIDAFGGDFDGIRWRFRLPGLSAVELPREEEGGEEISLLRARPGVKIPQHTHRGREMTLVLAGALRDGDTVFGPGDLEIADEAHDHRPEVHGSETCYCLIVLEGTLRFTGRFSRALNLFQS